MSSILVWDCSSCKSNSIKTIRDISMNSGVRFSKIILFAEEMKDFPKDADSVSSVLNTVIRIGEASLYDAIVDFILFSNEVKEIEKVFIISDSIEVWASLMQSITPHELAIISNNNQSESIEIQFLPESIKVSFIEWNQKQPSTPSTPKQQLKHEIVEQEEESETTGSPISIKNDASINEEEEEEVEIEEDLEEEEEEEEEAESVAKNDTEYSSSVAIKPLASIDADNLLDLRSPITGHHVKDLTSAFTPDTKKEKNEIVVSRKYQPLIEAMRSIGKSMVPLDSFVEELEKECQILGVPSQNAMSIISKASNDGIIIYDKTIKYIRFRNRSFSNVNIEYQ